MVLRIRRIFLQMKTSETMDSIKEEALCPHLNESTYSRGQFEREGKRQITTPPKFQSNKLDLRS